MKKIFQLLLLCLWMFTPCFKASAQTAGFQLIHNAADPALDTIDIYVNGNLAADDFAFRSATPSINALAGLPLNLGIAGGNSTGVNDTIKNFPITLTNGQVYAAMLTGVLNPGNFAANPDGQSTAFDLKLYNNIRLVSLTPGNAEYVTIHGITDAPIMDFVIRNKGTQADNSTYKTVSGYASVPALSSYLDLMDTAQGSIYTTYATDFSGLGDSTAVLFTSGFQDTSLNQGGAVAGLFGAFANGTVVEYPQVSIAFLQAIHNCADPAADSLDIYALGFLAVDNFEFRKATNYLEVPAGIPIDVGVALGNSASINDTIKNFPVVFENGKNYIAIATGVLDTSNFAANPNGINIGFNLQLIDFARVKALNPGDVDYLGVHGSTDAPMLDVMISGTGPVFFDNYVFGDVSQYVSATAISYNIDVTDSGNTVVYGSYLADLGPYTNQSGVVFSSGFWDPTANQNGASYGLFIAIPNGSVYPFPNITGIDNQQGLPEFTVAPNPANDFAVLRLSHAPAGVHTATLTDLTGKLLLNKVPMTDQTLTLDTRNMQPGLYVVQITFASGASIVKKLIVR